MADNNNSSYPTLESLGYSWAQEDDAGLLTPHLIPNDFDGVPRKRHVGHLTMPEYNSALNYEQHLRHIEQPILGCVYCEVDKARGDIFPNAD